jgi:hypothetical protein
MLWVILMETEKREWSQGGTCAQGGCPWTGPYRGTQELVMVAQRVSPAPLLSAGPSPSAALCCDVWEGEEAPAQGGLS